MPCYNTEKQHVIKPQELHRALQAGEITAAEADYRLQATVVMRGADRTGRTLTFTRDNCWRWASASWRTPAIMAWCLRNWMRRRVSSSGWGRERVM